MEQASFNFMAAVILEAKKMKSVAVSIVSPSICHEVKRHLLLGRKVMTLEGKLC